MTDDSGDPAAGDASDSDTGDAPDSAAGNDSRADPDSQDNDAAEELSLDRFHEALEAEERPVATASEVARRLGTTQAPRDAPRCARRPRRRGPA